MEKVDLTGRGDTHVWLLETSRVYSVKSFYKMISFGGISHELEDYIWKIKIPPNIHVLGWLIFNNKSLTRDNLAKRRHVADLSCVLCNEAESIQHSTGGAFWLPGAHAPG